MSRGPSDDQQFEAFKIGHMVFLVLDYYQDNSLFRSPIGDSPKTSELVEGVGQSTVRGVDLFPPPVTWMPPNCIFEVDDVLREWTWREPFDYIHIRLMYGASLLSDGTSYTNKLTSEF
ncbi:hypothetical protein N7451_012056 [Penicillium sp. IBT 35674x]|nr:hypothetical protein N7451_012056 [Penicillium sp. IBT 35674x]